MSKLQLYITINYDGYRNMLEINANDGVKQHVTNLSDAVALVDYDPVEKNIFYMLKYTDEGVFVILLRTIPTRPIDHLAAWIYVPYVTEISDAELNAAIEGVLRAVSGPKITSEEFESLRKLFDLSYDELSSAGATVQNTGTQYAHRFYDGDSGYTLREYIITKRYQTSYLNYAGVLIVSADSFKMVNGTDITSDPLEQMVRIFPPKLDANSKYRPTIFGQPFDKPYLVPLMGTIDIIWKSSNSQDIEQTLMVTKPNMRPDNITTVSTPKIRPIQTQTVTQTPPAAAAPAAAQSQKPNQSPNPSPISSLPQNQNRLHTYYFEIPAKSADIAGMIHFEIRSRNELEESPIEGYELTESIQEGPSRSNHLIYVSPNTILKNVLWGIGGLVVGAAIIFALFYTQVFSNSDANTMEQSEVSEEQAIVPTDTAAVASVAEAAAPEVPIDISLDAAIKYLDTNDDWEKSTLESYPDLKGLYDDLNTFNRQKLIDYWSPKLKDSRKFAKITEHCRLSKHKKPRVKAGQSTYNDASTTTIRVRSYLNTIDP